MKKMKEKYDSLLQFAKSSEQSDKSAEKYEEK